MNAKDTKLFLSWLDLKSIADEEKQGEEGELNELIRTSTITTNREEDTRAKRAINIKHVSHLFLN